MHLYLRLTQHFFKYTSSIPLKLDLSIFKCNLKFCSSFRKKNLWPQSLLWFLFLVILINSLKWKPYSPQITECFQKFFLTPWTYHDFQFFPANCSPLPCIVPQWSWPTTNRRSQSLSAWSLGNIRFFWSLLPCCDILVPWLAWCHAFLVFLPAFYCSGLSPHSLLPTGVCHSFPWFMKASKDADNTTLVPFWPVPLLISKPIYTVVCRP